MSLAIWRTANLLTDQAEPGPFDVLHRFRHLIGVRFDELNVAYAQNVIAEVFTCVWCLSVWLGLAWSILFWYAPSMALMISLPLALSAGAIIVKEKLI